MVLPQVSSVLVLELPTILGKNNSNELLLKFQTFDSKHNELVKLEVSFELNVTVKIFSNSSI